MVITWQSVSRYCVPEARRLSNARPANRPSEGRSHRGPDRPKETTATAAQPQMRHVADADAEGQTGAKRNRLNVPVNVGQPLPTPGERADALIGFSRFKNGGKIVLHNNTRTPFPDRPAQQAHRRPLAPPLDAGHRRHLADPLPGRRASRLARRPSRQRSRRSPRPPNARNVPLAEILGPLPGFPAHGAAPQPPLQHRQHRDSSQRLTFLSARQRIAAWWPRRESTGACGPPTRLTLPVSCCPAAGRPSTTGSTTGRP